MSSNEPKNYTISYTFDNNYFNKNVSIFSDTTNDSTSSKFCYNYAYFYLTFSCNS